MSDETTITRLRRAAADTAPSSPFDLDKVVRGGRARVRRRRLGTGAGVVALALAAGLVLPSSPVSVLDGEVARPPGTDHRPDPVVSDVVADDPVKSALWQAVHATLPGEVELAAEVGGDPFEPSLALQLRRGGEQFRADVVLFDVLDPMAGTERFRPCTRPEPLLEVVQDGRPCVEEPDDAGRWRVVADVLNGGTGLSILQDDAAGVLITWDLADTPTLERDEVAAIAEAAFTVGTGRRADWSTGLDLEAVAAGWGETLTMLESELELGMLGQRRPTEVDVPGTGRGAVIDALQTLDEVEVDLEVWQRAAPYEAVCETITEACSPLPGRVTEGAPDDPGSQVVRAAVGTRAGLVLRVGTTDEAVRPGMVAALERLAADLPRADR